MTTSGSQRATRSLTTTKLFRLEVDTAESYEEVWE